MKTWEMIKKLRENPEKTFISKGAGIFAELKAYHYIDEYGEKTIRIINNETNRTVDRLHIDRVWEEVKEPVDFMAVIAEVRHTQKLPITLVYEKYEVKYRNEYLSNVLNHLRTNFESNKIAEIIQNGKWYIED